MFFAAFLPCSLLSSVCPSIPSKKPSCWPPSAAEVLSLSAVWSGASPHPGPTPTAVRQPSLLRGAWQSSLQRRKASLPQGLEHPARSLSCPPVHCTPAVAHEICGKSRKRVVTTFPAYALLNRHNYTYTLSNETRGRGSLEYSSPPYIFSASSVLFIHTWGKLAVYRLYLSRLAINLLAPLVQEKSAEVPLMMVITATSNSSMSGGGRCKLLSSAKLCWSIFDTRSREEDTRISLSCTAML